MKHPLPVFAAILSAGICCQKLSGCTYSYVYIGAVLLFVLCVIGFHYRRWFDIFLCCLIFLLGAVHSANSNLLSKDHVFNLITNGKSDYMISGTITEEPAVDKFQFVMRAEKICTQNLSYRSSGLVSVRGRGRLALAVGDKVLVIGQVARIFLSDSRKGYAEYLNRRGIYVIMNVDSPLAITKIEAPKLFSFKRITLEAKKSAIGIFSRYLSGACAGIMTAMVLGEKSNISEVVNQFMMKTGTIHILVVSGFNVSIVLFIAVLLFKFMRLRRHWRIFAVIPLLLMYCFLTGASTPVVRATIMAIVFVLAYIFKRDADIFNSLAIAALVILGINPNQLFDIGFQLSFVSVVGIAYLYPKMKHFLRVDALGFKPVIFVYDSCLVSCSAWLATSGFIGYYFGSFSPVTVLANLFIVPLATLVTLCGIILLISATFTPFLANFFAYSCELSVSLLLGVNSFLSGLPGAHFALTRRQIW